MALDELTRCYDADGNRISWEEATELFEFFDERRVIEQTWVRRAFVSTVLLVYDHNWNENGPPLIFETMVFGGRYDRWQERYSTREQAKSGHREAVEMVRKTPFWRWMYDYLPNGNFWALKRRWPSG